MSDLDDIKYVVRDMDEDASFRLYFLGYETGPDKPYRRETRFMEYIGRAYKFDTAEQAQHFIDKDIELNKNMWEVVEYMKALREDPILKANVN